MTAAVNLIRSMEKNRFDNQMRVASVAIQRRRRSDRFRAVLPLSGVAARTVAQS
jgi:hypothetical protein